MRLHSSDFNLYVVSQFQMWLLPKDIYKGISEYTLAVTASLCWITTWHPPFSSEGRHLGYVIQPVIYLSLQGRVLYWNVSTNYTYYSRHWQFENIGSFKYIYHFDLYIRLTFSPLFVYKWYLDVFYLYHIFSKQYYTFTKANRRYFVPNWNLIAYHIKMKYGNSILWHFIKIVWRLFFLLSGLYSCRWIIIRYQ